MSPLSPKSSCSSVISVVEVARARADARRSRAIGSSAAVSRRCPTSMTTTRRRVKIAGRVRASRSGDQGRTGWAGAVASQRRCTTSYGRGTRCQGRCTTSHGRGALPRALHDEPRAWHALPRALHDELRAWHAGPGRCTASYGRGTRCQGVARRATGTKPSFAIPSNDLPDVPYPEPHTASACPAGGTPVGPLGQRAAALARVVRLALLPLALRRALVGAVLAPEPEGAVAGRVARGADRRAEPALALDARETRLARLRLAAGLARKRSALARGPVAVGAGARRRGGEARRRPHVSARLPYGWKRAGVLGQSGKASCVPSTPIL